jgi:hypothetical protein
VKTLLIGDRGHKAVISVESFVVLFQGTLWIHCKHIRSSWLVVFGEGNDNHAVGDVINECVRVNVPHGGEGVDYLCLLNFTVGVNWLQLTDDELSLLLLWNCATREEFMRKFLSLQLFSWSKIWKYKVILWITFLLIGFQLMWN